MSIQEELLGALKECLDVLTADTIGTIHMDDPDWYAAVYKAVDRARAVIAKVYVQRAAPDMLTALKKAVADYGHNGGPWNVPGEPGVWLAMARSAIAKAEGGEE